MPLFTYLKKGIPLIFLRLSPFICMFVSLSFMAKYKDSTLSAALGLSNSFYCCINYNFVLGTGEILGIFAGEYLGENKYEKMRTV